MNTPQHILCLLRSFYDPSVILRRTFGNAAAGRDGFVIPNFNTFKYGK